MSFFPTLKPAHEELGILQALAEIIYLKKNAKRLPNMPSPRTKFSGGGQEEVIFLAIRAHVLEKLSNALSS